MIFVFLEFFDVYEIQLHKVRYAIEFILDIL